MPHLNVSLVTVSKRFALCSFVKANAHYSVWPKTSRGHEHNAMITRPRPLDKLNLNISSFVWIRFCQSSAVLWYANSVSMRMDCFTPRPILSFPYQRIVIMYVRRWTSFNKPYQKSNRSWARTGNNTIDYERHSPRYLSLSEHRRADIYFLYTRLYIHFILMWR